MSGGGAHYRGGKIDHQPGIFCLPRWGLPPVLPVALLLSLVLTDEFTLHLNREPLYLPNNIRSPRIWSELRVPFFSARDTVQIPAVL